MNKKFKLMAIDTFEFGSDSFIVGEYDSVDKAKDSILRRNKINTKNTESALYKYHIIAPDGNKIFI